MAGAAQAFVNCPQSPASARIPSPWSHVVRGETDPVAPVPESTEIADQPLPVNPLPVDASAENAAAGGDGRGKKLAWSRPANGLGDAGVAVMGAVSWPALSECTRSSPKSSPAETLKSPSDGLGPVPPPPPPPEPVIASPPRKPSSSIPNPNPNPNHYPSQSQHPRQRSTKRVNLSPNGAPIAALPVVSGDVFIPVTVPDKYTGSEHSPRGNTPSHTVDYGSRAHGSGDHQRTYGGNRRGNGGGYGGNVGGYGGNSGGYGGRREQERGGGGYEWIQSRSFSGRDIRMQAPMIRGVPRAFMGPPSPSTAPFMVPPPPPPVGPYVNHLGFTDIMPSPVFYMPAPPEPPRGIPFVAPPVPPIMFMAQPDLSSFLLNQIDYYFSPENLCKDTYLRENMDDNGWVHVSLIASFNRIKQITHNMHYILEALKASEIVEVQGDKIRKRDDWISWLLPPSPHSYGGGSKSPTIPKIDHLVARVQKVALVDNTINNQNAISGSDFHQS